MYDLGDWIVLITILSIAYMVGYGWGWRSGRDEGFNVGYHRGRSINWKSVRDGADER